MNMPMTNGVLLENLVVKKYVVKLFCCCSVRVFENCTLHVQNIFCTFIKNENYCNLLNFFLLNLHEQLLFNLGVVFTAPWKPIS